MAMAVGSSEGQSYSDINMTPLIDVMLVLLIIFIITIPSQTHAVKIDNPLPPPPNFTPPPPPEVIDLSIDFDGTLLWNKTPVDRPTLQGYIATEAANLTKAQVLEQASVAAMAQANSAPQVILSLLKSA